MQGVNVMRKVLTGLTVLLLATPAFADMSLPYGWYLEANAGSSKLTNTNLPGNVSSSGIGYNGDLGYKFMPYVATELGYTQYANSTVKNGAGTKAGIGKHYSWDLALRGILPFYTSGFEAFAKVGVQRLAESMNIQSQTAATALGLGGASHSTTGLYVGVGVQYYFMPEFAINAQWAEAKGNSSTGTSQLLSAGASFIFG